MVRVAVQRMLAKIRPAACGLPGESGQTLAEYSLIISAIAVGTVLLAVLVFRTELTATFDSVTDCLNRVSC